MNCPTDSFQCKGGCISWEYVCDGISHCQYGEDESICGKCIRNEYTCLDGSKMACEMSCSILGSIPCVKYRNRITCIRDYPEAIGSFYKNNNNNNNNKQLNDVKTTTINFLFSNSYIFYILVALIIIILLIVGVIVFYFVYKKFFQQQKQQQKKNKRLLIKNSKKQNKICDADDITLQLNIREIVNSETLLNESLTKLSQTNSTTDSNQQEQQQQQQQQLSHLYFTDDDEHKYHEINDDLSILSSASLSSSSSRNVKKDLSQLFSTSTSTDNNNFNYANHDPNDELIIQPPPYNKIHMFKNVNNNNNAPIQGKSTYV